MAFSFPPHAFCSRCNILVAQWATEATDPMVLVLTQSLVLHCGRLYGTITGGTFGRGRHGKKVLGVLADTACLDEVLLARSVK